VLSSGELRCIGSTTYREYRGVFEKDHALARRFQKIDITEPSIPQTIEILRGLKTRFEHRRALRGRSADRGGRALRHIGDRRLPDNRST
jgi:ATP-dependent Clp protease ATP-binding subunit ClpA